MPKASNLQKGNIIRIDGQPYQVKHIEVHSPSARGANTLYKVRFTSLINGQKLNQSYKGNDMLEEMTVERRRSSYLFREQDLHTFMDSENYEQYTMNAETIKEELPWLVEGMEGITVLLHEGNPIAIEIPLTIDVEVVSTAPAIKGASVTNRNKPAELANGVTVLVPEYLGEGEMIRVNTETGQYMSRVKN